MPSLGILYRDETKTVSKVYILHENDEWLPPFRAALNAEGIPFDEWHMAKIPLDWEKSPPEGVFYNRMSASSHTRGHRSAPEYTAGALSWLANYERRVVNGRQALDLELSKLRQYQALRIHGIQTPRTWAARNDTELKAFSQNIPGPFITKHNRGGKGLGVHLFQHGEALAKFLDAGKLEPPVDGIYLIQQYIQSREPFITRCEFIDGQFVYAVRVSTENGFELCPADSCQPGGNLCPATKDDLQRFQIIEDFAEPLLLKRYQAFLQSNAIEVAGIEFITDENSCHWTYDINTNTNYNHTAEKRAKVSAPRKLAKFLGSLLDGNVGHLKSAVI